MSSFYICSCLHFIYVHVFISFYLLSISPLVRLRYCRLHIPVYLSLSLCCSFQLPLFLLAFLSVPFHASFFSLDYFLCTVLSPSTAPISGVPPLFNYPASFILHKSLVITEGRIRQGKSGNLISSPGKGKYSFFLSPKRPASLQDPKLKMRGAIPPLSQKVFMDRYLGMEVILSYFPFIFPSA